MPRLSVALAALLLLAIPSTALAADRYATPTATNVNGACSITSPCRIDHAVETAVSGDTVHVASGTYVIAKHLHLADGATL